MASNETTRRDSLRELGDFLRAKRRTVSPEQNGLTTTRRRLVPGLSRDEAASIADIGTSWYARLEAGRVAKPTLSTMRAVSRALQLNDAEIRFALDLAGLLPPSPNAGPAAVSAALAALIADREPIALSLWDRFLMPLGWNAVADGMYEFSINDRFRRHPVVRLADERAIAFFGDHYEAYACNLVGMFRRAYSASEPTADAQHVHDLAQSIPIFQKYWGQHVVADSMTSQDLTFERNHPVVGTYRATSTDLLVNDEHVLLRIVAPADDAARVKFVQLRALGKSSRPEDFS